MDFISEKHSSSNGNGCYTCTLRKIALQNGGLAIQSYSGASVNTIPASNIIKAESVNANARTFKVEFKDSKTGRLTSLEFIANSTASYNQWIQKIVCIFSLFLLIIY